jgi:hypothetical protein
MNILPLLALAQGAVIVIIVVVVAIGYLIYWLTDESYRLTITPSATTMIHNQSVTVTVDFEERTWRFGDWTAVGATFGTKVNALTAVLAPVPATAVTTAAAPRFTIRVTGTNPGTDTLQVTATMVGSTITATGNLGLTVTAA